MEHSAKHAGDGARPNHHVEGQPLPTWTARVMAGNVPLDEIGSLLDGGRSGRGPRRRRTIRLVAVATLSLFVLVAIGSAFWLGRRLGAQTSVAGVGSLSSRTDAQGDASALTTAISGPVLLPTTTVPTPGVVTPTSVDPLNRGHSERYGVFTGGKLYLRGAMPSQTYVDTVVSKIGAVLGKDNVVDQSRIDPSVGSDVSLPVYVEDVVLFKFNSVKIEPEFVPLLDLGAMFLARNPGASITVVTRTDATGSPDVNLEVSKLRADAIIKYWVQHNVDPRQVKADPRGEEGASADDDVMVAAQERRAEFVLAGLVD